MPLAIESIVDAVCIVLERVAIAKTQYVVTLVFDAEWCGKCVVYNVMVLFAAIALVT